MDARTRTSTRTGTRAAVAAVAGAAALLGPAATQATALSLEPPQTLHVAGQVIPGGADGRPHELFCPAPQSAFSGGFAISASKGSSLARESADILESRPNDDATGWIVTVRKQQIRPGADPKHPHTGPADLVIHLACTEGMPTHGM
ncbi:hypothetical protein [Streptomyces sp. H39-S7]|uniref:hypothetical protein n=1 Tax=Streptomyces sp. H39-S7 TaxID=3004357 RepID=UPI0022AECBC4|nr:hypothetical protein [Streptomyces sp. H39-S7]MCZ4123526.1 hypothetical protein [Streptomyces sp. H39-S7]